MIKRLGATPAGVWAIKHLISPLQLWFYRAAGGAGFVRPGANHGILLLTTVGRRSGKQRVTPLFFLRQSEAVILCNVNPGFERTNPWILNLRACPQVQLQIGREVGWYQARLATPAETDHLWPGLLALWPAYQQHYTRSGKRTIFILEPCKARA